METIVVSPLENAAVIPPDENTLFNNFIIESLAKAIARQNTLPKTIKNQWYFVINYYDVFIGIIVISTDVFNLQLVNKYNISLLIDSFEDLGKIMPGELSSVIKTSLYKSLAIIKSRQNLNSNKIYLYFDIDTTKQNLVDMIIGMNFSFDGAAGPYCRYALKMDLNNLNFDTFNRKPAISSIENHEGAKLNIANLLISLEAINTTSNKLLQTTSNLDDQLNLIVSSVQRSQIVKFAMYFAKTSIEYIKNSVTEMQIELKKIFTEITTLKSYFIDRQTSFDEISYSSSGREFQISLHIENLAIFASRRLENMVNNCNKLKFLIISYEEKSVEPAAILTNTSIKIDQIKFNKTKEIAKSTQKQVVPIKLNETSEIPAETIKFNSPKDIMVNNVIIKTVNRMQLFNLYNSKLLITNYMEYSKINITDNNNNFHYNILVDKRPQGIASISTVQNITTDLRNKYFLKISCICGDAYTGQIIRLILDNYQKTRGYITIYMDISVDNKLNSIIKDIFTYDSMFVKDNIPYNRYKKIRS